MNAADVAKIYANYKIIVDNVNFDEIKDYLYSNIDDFDSEDMEKIEKRDTKPSKMRLLLKTLLGKTSPDVLKYFCNSLRESQVKSYASLAEYIENTDPSAISIDSLDSSNDAKINVLKERCIEQSRILKDETKPLSEVKEFKQLDGNGELVVSETITEFSKHIKLRFKKASATKEIAFDLGVDALSGFSSELDNKYTRAMRKLVNGVSNETGQEISKLIKSLHILEMMGYSTVETIAKELYTEINWGRIIVWFAFWKGLASHLEGNSEEFKTFGKYVGFHLASNCELWIKDNGGWDAILNMPVKKNSGFLRLIIDRFVGMF